MRFKIVSFLIFLSISSFAQDNVSDETTVNDNDKTSSRVNNMFQDVETVERTYSAYNTGKSTVKTAKKIKNFDDVKSLSINKLKSSLTDKVFKYKNAKAGFLKVFLTSQPNSMKLLGK